jgi:uncharacterized spore protein YtfJ
MTIRELVEQFRETATVKTVFGEPIERAGVTVIPAARVLGGGGGGEGEGPQAQGKGTVVRPEGQARRGVRDQRRAGNVEARR